MDQDSQPRAPSETGANLPPRPVAEDDLVLAALRAGSEEAFAAFVRRHHASLRRIVFGYVRDSATAEEVVQEAWLGFLKSLASFEGRCALRTWLYQIALNKARTRFQRDLKVLPFSKVVSSEVEAQEVAVDPGRFQGPDGPYPRHWAAGPAPWVKDPVVMAEERETVNLVREAIGTLPPAQGTVMRLRDVDGLNSEDVCNVLGISETNQRVLLHRARCKVRKALADRFKHAARES